ncbi:hypothetical protein CTAYLR_004872 [Chrysophaeum taylorii]|uniref:Protein kinase domain-containing protein n=1 Tax=Chrysophaeum taylorii TaxID=2483200 RepID=A0AAD7XKX5_9STRA|nr:hypothetical protein CTAYLR_004872 [Chrysophaeum taylorii]
MAECEGKFYCAPCNADSILLIEPPPVVVEKPPPQEALEVVVVEGKRDEPQASVVALRRAAERVEAARNCDIACDVEKDAERDVVLLLLEPVSTAMARFRREEEEEGGGDDSSRRDPTTLGFLENFQQLRRKARAEGDKLDEAQDLVRRALSSTTSKEEGCGELESLVEQRDAARSAYARALIALQDGYSSSDLARERSALERDADLFEATLSSLEKIRNEFQQGRRSTTTPTTIREGGVTKEAAALREFEVWKQSTDPDAVTDATDNALADSWHKLRDVAETLGANEACEAWKVSYLVAMEAVDRELNFWSSRPHPFSLLPVDPIRKVVVPRLGACRRNLSDLGRADSIVREASRVVEEFGIAEASALLGDKPWREANKRLRAAKKMFRTSRRALEDAQHELEDAKLLGVDDDDDDDDGDDDELVHDDDKREEIVAPPPDLAVFNEEVRAARQELHRAQHAAEDALSKLIDLVRDHYPELGSVAKEAFATVVALSPALRSVVRQGRSQEDYERIPWPDNTEPRASRHVVIACVYDGLPCVLKQFHLRNSSERRALEREVELLVALDHPNIIKLECVFFAENCRPGDAEAVVQTPLYRGGTLRRWLSRPENKVDATETSFSRVGSMRFLNADHRQVATTHVRALRQLLAGLSYVHAKGVVHGDVKLDNALVDVSSTGTSWTVVLSDFEMSHRRRRECTTALDGTSMDMTTTTVGGGTRGYVAPELLVLRDNDGARSTTASDVFAYGICVGVALAVDDATTERTGFDGCFALKCHRCACGFCAYCLADCGTDAHQHVRTCAHGQGLFPTRARETFLRVQRARRDRDLRAYLSKLSSDDVRVVVARLDRELRDLGLDPRAYLLTETPRDSTTNS